MTQRKGGCASAHYLSRDKKKMDRAADYPAHDLEKVSVNSVKALDRPSSNAAFTNDGLAVRNRSSWDFAVIVVTVP